MNKTTEPMQRQPARVRASKAGSNVKRHEVSTQFKRTLPRRRKGRIQTGLQQEPGIQNRKVSGVSQNMVAANWEKELERRRRQRDREKRS